MLIALKTLLHRGYFIQVGDPVPTDEVDARALVARGEAKQTNEAPPVGAYPTGGLELLTDSQWESAPSEVQLKPKPKRRPRKPAAAK